MILDIPIFLSSFPTSCLPPTPPKGDQSIPGGAVHRPGLLPGQGDPPAAGPHVQGQHRLRVKPKGSEDPNYRTHPTPEREFTSRGEASSRMAGWTDLWPLLPLQHFQLALIDSNPCTLSKAESEYSVSVFVMVVWFGFSGLHTLECKGGLTQTLSQLMKSHKSEKSFSPTQKIFLRIESLCGSKQVASALIWCKEYDFILHTGENKMTISLHTNTSYYCVITCSSSVITLHAKFGLRPEFDTWVVIEWQPLCLHIVNIHSRAFFCSNSHVN